MTKKNKLNRKGFTLVELVVVIAIIGILSMIIVPSVISYVRKARVAAAIADTRTIKASIESSLTDELLLTNEDKTAAFNKVPKTENMRE